ncbi:MAG: hypothetical protein EAZ42_12515 [Verrucomicrobia bacterium]|nr:MAG: hypothetical protein EAZ42_12515 [Verrucomicrobiota bacterium]
MEGVPFDGNLVIKDGSAGDLVGGTLILQSGRTLTITNGSLTISSLQGTIDVDTDSFAVLEEGSTLNCNNVAFDLVVNAKDNSTVNIFAATPPGVSRNTVNGDDPPTPANGTKVVLWDGSKIVHNNGNDASNAGAQSVGKRIIRQSTGTSFFTDFGTPPLTEFSLTGASAPFQVATTSLFSITAGPPPPGLAQYGPDIVVGYRLAPPETDQPIWYPTFRDATDWQINLDNTNIVRFGFVGITDVYLADMNGDGRDDKVMRQTANNGGTNPSQIIVNYTTPGGATFNGSYVNAGGTGFLGTGFNPPNGGADGDIKVPFGFLSAANTKLVFGDLDGDRIADTGVYLDGSDPNIGQPAGTMVWGMVKSNNVKGIATDFGPGPIFPQFTGWKAFGITGDLPFMGDFNRDGIADRMLHRPSSNQIFIDLSVPGGFGDGVPNFTIVLGIAGDKVFVSDINGDGLDDLVLARDPSPIPAETATLQRIYGYFNDGNGFASISPANPNITDVWGKGEGLLFGRLDGPGGAAAIDLTLFKITAITSSGPNSAFAGNFFAPSAGTYTIEGNTNLQNPWVTLATIPVAAAGSTAFSISDATLDTNFGNVRPKVFLRATLQP